MPGFEETEQGCSPSQHGKIFHIIYEKMLIMTTLMIFFIDKATVLLQHPVTRRITARHTDSVFPMGIRRNTCAFVCLVTSVSRKAQRNFLPSVDNS